MSIQQHSSLSILRLTAEHLKQIRYPQLTRPQVGPTQSATIELVQCGIQAYSLPWIRHFGVLVSGIVTLSDSENKAAVSIVGRSSFELCDHAYYVKKHLKQHLEAKNLSAAWEFLLPIATGSRYINEIHSEESELFPVPPHVQKAINCFKEVASKETEDDDYNYLTEYFHPNFIAFHHHHRWVTPDPLEFEHQIP